jgi:hypothetical protein
MPVDLKARPNATELSVIVLCFNERHNIAVLIDKLDGGAPQDQIGTHHCTRLVRAKLASISKGQSL